MVGFYPFRDGTGRNLWRVRYRRGAAASTSAIAFEQPEPMILCGISSTGFHEFEPPLAQASSNSRTPWTRLSGLRIPTLRKRLENEGEIREFVPAPERRDVDHKEASTGIERPKARRSGCCWTPETSRNVKSTV